MRKYDTVPKPCSTSEYRIVDLSRDGLPFLPVFIRRHNSKHDGNSVGHRHAGFIEVIFCLKGDRTLCDHKGTEIAFRPGDVFVAQPEDFHCLKTYPKGLETHCLWIKLADPKERQFPHLASTESRDLLRRLRKLPVRFTGGETVRRLFDEVWANIDSPADEPLRGVSLRLAVYNLLTGLVKAAAKPEQPHSSRPLDALLAEMQAHPERPWPVGELAERMNVNVMYLNRLFKRAVGLTPHAWLTCLRIEQAKELLADGRTGIAAIAHRLGSASPQHFTAHFRKETSVSPKTWQAENTPPPPEGVTPPSLLTELPVLAAETHVKVMQR